jgi:hypothetical protein
MGINSEASNYREITQHEKVAELLLMRRHHRSAAAEAAGADRHRLL